jgi:hypothetical protein
MEEGTPSQLPHKAFAVADHSLGLGKEASQHANNDNYQNNESNENDHQGNGD